MVTAVASLVLGSTTGVTLFGIGLTTATGALTLAGSLVNLAGSALLNYALTARPEQPDAPRPENIQINSKNEAAPRLCAVGRVKLGGNVVFHRAAGGISWRIVTHSHGAITEIESYLLNNVVVDVVRPGAVPPAGFIVGDVTDDQYQKRRPRVRIFSRLGAVPETPYPLATAEWPEWTENHRLDGQSSSLIICEQVSAEAYRAMYPRDEPQLQLIIKGRAIFDPRDDSTAFSENAALIINHFIESPDGLNAPGALDVETLKAQADIADLQRVLADLSTESRWRLGGVWTLSETPQAVLRRMLDACAGRIYLRPDGKGGLSLGYPAAPTVTLTFADLIEVQEVAPGPDRLSRYNILPARYSDHDLRFAEVDAQAWEDPARQVLDGEETAPMLDLTLAPSHPQARAAMKHRFHRDNPERRLRAVWKPRAQVAVYEQAVTLDLAELGLSGDWDVQGWNLHFRQDTGLLEAVSLDLTSITPGRDTLLVEEHGIPQTVSDPSENDGLPAPVGFVAAGQGFKTASNSYVAAISVGWDAPASDVLQPILEYSEAGADVWTVVPMSVEATTARIAPLVDGGDYDIALSFEAPDGTRGPRVVIAGVTAIAAGTVPLPPTGLTVLDQGSGQALVTVTASASEDQWRTIVYRDGVEIARLTSFASETMQFLDAPGAGEFTWTAVALNVSEKRSDDDNPALIAGPVTETIT